MSTSAYFTFHNLPTDSKHGLSTVTFYRHCDGYMGAQTADMFYQLFVNKFSAKGRVEAMICAAPADIDLHSFEECAPIVCNGDYHYHLDFDTMSLTVLHHDWVDRNAEVETVFCATVDRFINHYSEDTKAIVSKSHYSNRKEVFTRDGMFKDIAERMKQLQLNMRNPQHPLNTAYTKQIDRMDVFLSDMNLTKNQQDLREIVQNLVTQYQVMILA